MTENIHSMGNRCRGSEMLPGVVGNAIPSVYEAMWLFL